MYSVSRKNWENIAPPRSSRRGSTPASVRRRKIRSGSSGAVERSSIDDEREDQGGRGGEQPERRAVAQPCWVARVIA